MRAIIKYYKLRPHISLLLIEWMRIHARYPKGVSIKPCKVGAYIFYYRYKRVFKFISVCWNCEKYLAETPTVVKFLGMVGKDMYI